MKATSLIGDLRVSASAEDAETTRQTTSANGGEVSVAADVIPDRRMNSRSDKASFKSTKSDTSEVCGGLLSNTDQILCGSVMSNSLFIWKNESHIEMERLLVVQNAFI